MRTKRIVPAAALAIAILASCSNPTDSTTDTASSSLSSAKAITSFAFLKASNSALAQDYTAVITGTGIVCTLPNGTVRSALVPTFAVSAKASASPASGLAQDFSSAKSCVVTAEDGSTQTYTVTVKLASQADSTTSSLSNLVVTDASTYTSLLSGFDAGTTSYSIAVANSVSSVRITPTATSAYASISVGLAGGAASSVTSGYTSSSISLAQGTNDIAVKVIALDGSSTTYTISIDRGAPIGLVIDADWTVGTLGATENISSGGFCWYTFPATIGETYQVAIDDTSTSGAAWTTTNGGYVNSYNFGPTATAYFGIYRADKSTAYSYPEIGESTQYPGYYLADYSARYLTITALDQTVMVKVAGLSSYSQTFAIRVRHRTDLASPTSISLGSWQEATFPSGAWTILDTPSFSFDATVGQEYRIGIDDVNQPTSEDGHGWSTTNGGSTTKPTATYTVLRILRPDGTAYTYADGSTGWILGDEYEQVWLTSSTYTYKERRYLTVKALDSKVAVEVKYTTSMNYGSGTFYVQARPVISSSEALSAGTAWTDSSYTEDETAWDQIREYQIPTVAGTLYEVGVDDRDYDYNGYADYNDIYWDSKTGGSATVAATIASDASYLKQRALTSSGEAAAYVQQYASTLTKDSDGWFEADGDMASSGQQRFFTVRGDGTPLTLQLKSVLSYVFGPYAVQARAVPTPTTLAVGADWVLGSVSLSGTISFDPWQISDTAYFSVATTVGTTYYVSVDDKDTYDLGWISSNGGYSTTPTASVSAWAIRSDGTIYALNGSSYTTFVHCDGSSSAKYFYFTAEESASTIVVSSRLYQPQTTGTFAIKVGASAP